MEHRKSLGIAQDKVREHVARFDVRLSNNKLAKLNTEISPGCLGFYHEALVFSALCRSFIVYTYPLSHRIVNKSREALFAENQYCLEYALETLDGILKMFPVERLVTTTESSICQASDFASIKSRIIDMKCHLTEQFENALKEFSDDTFLEAVETEFDTWNKTLKANTKPEKVPSKAPKKNTKTGKKNKVGNEQQNDWYCGFCTYYNTNRPQTECSVCGKHGKPNSV